MKKILRLSSLFLVAFVLLLGTFPVAMAASATINGKAVDVGKEVTYILYLGDVPDPIEAIDMSIYYDSDVLEYVNRSYVSMGFPSGMANPGGIKGESLLNASNIYGYDFSKTKEVLRITYKVISPGSTDITYKIRHLNTIYEDAPGEYLSRYVLTYTLRTDKAEIIVTEPPIINTDPQYSNENGVFVMQPDGLGADNGKPLDPERTNPEKRATKPDAGQDAVIDENGNVISNGQAANSASGGSQANIIVIVVIILILLPAAIALIVVFASRAINKDGNEKNDDNDDN
ncbi:MAG: cohesin domain-containing protein [Oscillospiraceae bacterium]|jgi:hypothetical protein|nr:cohesin domain-containing protein [Oscillospiraceae bacterium]